MLKKQLDDQSEEDYIDILEENNSAEKDAPSFFSVFKRISQLALPMGLSFTFSFEVFLSVLFLQLLSESEDDLAAATLVSIFMNTVCILALSPIYGGSLNLSEKLGKWEKSDVKSESDKEKIESVGINTLLIASATTIPATLSFVYSKAILVDVFHQNPSVAATAERFLRPYALAIPAFALRMSTEQIIFSFRKSKQAMLIALPSFSIGVALSVLFGFGLKLGPIQFPDMKQSGIALGFAFEAYATAASYFIFTKLNKDCGKFNFYEISFGKIKRNLSVLAEILRLGGAITFSYMIDLSLTLAIGIFSGLLGVKAQSAMSYCMQLIYFEFIMIAAFAYSCAQEISRDLGANNLTSIPNTARYGVLTTLVFLAPLPIFFSIYPEALEFISGGASEDVSKMLRTLLPIMSAGVIIDSVRYNLQQQLRALDDLLIPNIISLFGMSGGIGLAALLGLYTTMGVDGIGAGYTVSIGLTAGALFLRWNARIKEKEASSETETRNCLSSCFDSFFHHRSSKRNSSNDDEARLIHELDSVSPYGLAT